MPPKRTPPKSPLSSEFASPLQHYPSDSNVSEIGQDAVVSAASSLSNITARNVQKRKRDHADDLSKAEMMNMLSAMEKRNDAKHDLILSSIGDLKISVDYMAAKYEEAVQRIDFLESERKNDRKYIQLLESRLELQDHNARSTSIEIRNVPLAQKETKENLRRLITCTAEVLQIPLQKMEIKNIYRVNTKAAVKPIIADFTTVDMRDSFLTSFKKYNKEHPRSRLSTAEINIVGPSQPVYISENLTQMERKLFYHTREFAKNNGFLFCWTAFGRVFLRKTEGSPQIRVYCESELEDLKNK